MISTLFSRLISQKIYNPALDPSVRTLTGWGFINRIVPRIIQIAFIVGVTVFFFVLIIGAIQWITSGGDKGKIESARSKVANGFTGLVVLFSIFAVVKIINVLFGIDIGNLGP